MEPDCFNNYCSLGISIFRVPTEAARARQDRRGPSLRPCLKGDPGMKLIAYKTMTSHVVLLISVFPTALESVLHPAVQSKKRPFASEGFQPSFPAAG